MMIQKNFSLFFAFSDTYIQMNPFFSRESMIWGTTKSQGLYGFFCLMRLWDHIKACLGLTTATLGCSVTASWAHHLVAGFVSRMTKMHPQLQSMALASCCSEMVQNPPSIPQGSRDRSQCKIHLYIQTNRFLPVALWDRYLRLLSSLSSWADREGTQLA